MQSLEKVEPQIEKVGAISYDQFIENYVKPGKPVVFKNASASWKSKRAFDPDFFREHFGDYKTTHKDKVYTMNEVLDITEKSTAENPAPYPMAFELRSQLPEFLAMLDPIHMNYAYPNWFRSRLIPQGRFGNDMQLYIGGVGNQYVLHKDLFHTNAWVTQLYGEKKFIAYPREQEDLLYPENRGTRSPINYLKPDYEKYPKYREATPHSVVLKAGETIYIPNGIWHTTVATCHNISIIVEQLNATNFSEWKQDIADYMKPRSAFKSIVQYGYAEAIGSLCKLREMAGKKFY
ncbi:cupin-like domain-containing protein [Larkinella bovis]|uniref:Cupin-like domain-containing protein n=1 Tax=Larkinella bovis TaxID=683041 RepID=A0ABW0IJF8_9BACT